MGVPIADLRADLSKAEPKVLPSLIVNAPFTYRPEMVKMGIGIMVLLVADGSDGLIHRIALSNTEMATGTLRYTSKKFEDIKIPIDYEKNIIAQAIATNKPHMTDDWRFLFAPAMNARQARLNQAGGSIACSHVYPLNFGNCKGALIFSFFKDPLAIGRQELDFMAEYSRAASEALASARCTSKMLVQQGEHQDEKL